MHKDQHSAIIAFDRSARYTDVDGRMHVEKTHISKAIVNPYYAEEIPGWQELGLTPGKVYHLLRDPVELERAAPTFANIQILQKHIKVSADDPQEMDVVGCIGSNVEFKAPYLDADICVWTSRAIAGIETDQIRELSCSYHYVPVMEPGEYEGVKYDGRMTQISGNHLALVEVGRAGSDVLVADHNPFIQKETPAMNKTKLGYAILVALQAASPKLATDSALPSIVGGATKKAFDREAVKKHVVAQDAEFNGEQLDKILDAILDVEQDPKPQVPMVEGGAGDESPAEQIKALLAGKCDEAVINQVLALLNPAAQDEDPKAEGDKPEDKDKDKGGPAMDAAINKAKEELRKEFVALNKACQEVRSTVGDVIGMDSAGSVYAFALDHLKVAHDGISDPVALRALYMASKPKEVTIVAQDQATTLPPELSRFGRAI